MITNFEEQTEDLTELELKHLDEIKGFIEILFENNFLRKPIKQDKLTDYINECLITSYGLFTPLKINSARLRKYFSYFRCNGILPIIATKDGCYLSQDREEIEKQILSLEQRSRQIAKAADGMKKFLI
jgi:hypothetical protein